MALGLVSKILDSVDVIVLVSEQGIEVDAEVLNLRHVEPIIAPERVGIDDAIGLSAFFKSTKQACLAQHII
jgi:hypothetical protein